MVTVAADTPGTSTSSRLDIPSPLPRAGSKPASSPRAKTGRVNGNHTYLPSLTIQPRKNRGSPLPRRLPLPGADLSQTYTLPRGRTSHVRLIGTPVTRARKRFPPPVRLGALDEPLHRLFLRLSRFTGESAKLWMYSTGMKTRKHAWRYKSEGYQVVYTAGKQNTEATVLKP